MNTGSIEFNFIAGGFSQRFKNKKEGFSQNRNDNFHPVYCMLNTHPSSNHRIIESPTYHDPRLADALNNESQYIAQLIEMPDNILTKKLGIIRQQMEMAYEKNLTAALETLSIWERQIIEARLIKGDFDDAPPQKPVKKKALKEKKIPAIEEAPEEDTLFRPAPDALPPKPEQLVLFG